ncbi:Ornithine decarboxylase 2 [Habropoda laboriosa]|uniref:Ornithine decarboxylase 2 n=1 Tax=Habropoda laboriosa TaxID=597456 RepID=A0A0L7QUS9_9HYME|nr:Ornithine decarboxylase 2 [Habropoda laboriosa]
MSCINFNEVKLFEDTDTDTNIIRSIIDKEHDTTQEPFCILDVADMMQKHKNWMSKMPRVIPHYAVKCNSNPMVLKILAAMNCSFDCASEEEIKQVMELGVSVKRIIFANPTKWSIQIKFAKKVNVDVMTVDGELEILKIKDVFPEAKIVIRFRCDAKGSLVSLGTKFGCDPDDEAVRLIHLTKSLGLTLWGFSFHVGSPCGDLSAYSRGIEICKKLMGVAKSIGCENVQLIDIGGGFSGNRDYCIDKAANIINDAIKDIDPSIKIISEPGQYYVTSAFTLASYLHTKRVVSSGEKMIRMYFMSCGVYNCFIEELLNLKARLPVPLDKPASDEKFPSSVWGPTCDSLDCILKDVMLQEFHIGDWLIWTDMGSYSISVSSPFNGFNAPKIYPFARKSQWLV